MLSRTIRPTKGTFRSILVALFGALLIIGMTASLTSTVSAQDEKPDNAVGYYIQDGKVVWIIPGGGIEVTKLDGLTPSTLEKLYPMTPQAEAAIVHPIPASPIIIDGTRFEGEQIALFNGKRLRFIEGKDGRLYAFTTSEKLEQFQKEQISISKQVTTDSVFYKDTVYTGQAFSLAPGYGIPYLYQIGFDNCISSTKATTTGSWSYIFDDISYRGDYFAMASGSSYPWLLFQGWDNRASSVWINQ